MTLRARLSLFALLAIALVVAGFGILAYFYFASQQDAQLETLLLQDLERIALLLDRPALGTSFTDAAVAGFILQFVTPTDQVVMSWGQAALLPLNPTPQRLRLGERIYLSGSAPWETTRGTVRLAHDVSSAVQSREALRRSLALSGVLVTLVAALGLLVGVRRALRPLIRVAAQARLIDPTAPGVIGYQGPRDEIHALIEALNAALAAIRSRQQDERAFLLEVAHELAGPLTLVSHHLTGVAGDHPHDPRLRSAAEAARELLYTSQDLLVLARGELERPLELEVFTLNTLLERVALEYPGVRLEAEGPAEVVGDPERMMQVLRNLVRNGVQAAGGANKVRVALRSDGPQHVLEVRDEGPGMREDVLAHIFERHYSRGRGAGVGLSISKALVEQHGGAIQAFSALGEGSRLVVRLPSFESRLEPAASPGFAGAEGR